MVLMPRCRKIGRGTGRMPNREERGAGGRVQLGSLTLTGTGELQN